MDYDLSISIRKSIFFLSMLLLFYAVFFTGGNKQPVQELGYHTDGESCGWETDSCFERRESQYGQSETLKTTASIKGDIAGIMNDCTSLQACDISRMMIQRRVTNTRQRRAFLLLLFLIMTGFWKNFRIFEYWNSRKELLYTYNGCTHRKRRGPPEMIWQECEDIPRL